MGSGSGYGGTQLAGWDIAVIVLYFVSVFSVGIWSSLRNRGSFGGYFLAGRDMHFIPVGASLFASCIGSGHFLGLAGTGAASGVAIAMFELHAVFMLLLLGWYFVPVYIASGVYTMPEYLRLRFGGQRIRVYLAVLALLLSIFTKVSAELYAGAVFIETALHWNVYAAIIALLAIAAIFTITGGLTAVIWTDFIQTVIMIAGAVVLCIISFIKVGGFEGVERRFLGAISNTTRYLVNHPELTNNTDAATCGAPPLDSFHIFRPITDPNLPWTGITFGLTISAVWYWCSDQVIVQRALAAKNLSHAKAGTIVAGYIKILPLFLLVLPGMISRILYPDDIGCSDPDVCEKVCGIRSGCTNLAYPYLVVQLMPVGLKGLMLAVMMAALMSSLTSIFNSSSTIFTIDIWTRMRKQASDTELMIVGRVFVLFMVVVSILWLPVLKSFAELFHYIQSITSYLAPPVMAVYVLALSWQRINEKGAFWGLMVGLVVGVIRFVLDFSFPRPPCGTEDTRPVIIRDVHYLHFGIFLWAVVTIVTIAISLMTKPIPKKHLHRLTFGSRCDTEDRKDIDDAGCDDGKELDISMEQLQNNNIEVEGLVNNAYHEEMPESVAVKASPDDDNHKPVPCWLLSIQWICGIEKQKGVPLSTEEQQAQTKKHTSLAQKPFTSAMLNINALIVMAVVVFIIGLFY